MGGGATEVDNHCVGTGWEGSHSLGQTRISFPPVIFTSHHHAPSLSLSSLSSLSIALNLGLNGRENAPDVLGNLIGSCPSPPPRSSPFSPMPHLSHRLVCRSCDSPPFCSSFCSRVGLSVPALLSLVREQGFPTQGRRGVLTDRLIGSSLPIHTFPYLRV